MKKRRYGYQTIIASVITAVLLAGNIEYSSIFYVQAQETADDITDTGEDISEETGEEEILSEEMTLTFDTLPDNDELMEGYIEQLSFGKSDSGISAYGVVGDRKLKDASEKKMYAVLKSAAEEIASGKRTSTVIEVGGLNLTKQTWGDSAKKVVSYLMMDCPYDLYWYNKSRGGGVNISCQYNQSTGTIPVVKFTFSVAKEYQGANETTTNPGVTGAAAKAVAKAKGIVASHASKTDWDKLNSYKQEICSLTDYNHDALKPDTPYGNPWQLIYVFDNDPNTNVVCEGYSKAFQYLCDLSSFSANTTCYTVTGAMNGGGHMWNVVALDGKNYMADVTNSDTGTIGFRGELFLTLPTAGTVDSGYTFVVGSQSISYIYDSDSITLLGKEILELPGTGGTGESANPDIKPDTAPVTKPEDTGKENLASKYVSLSLNGQSLKNNAVLKVSFKKKYAFKASVTDADGREVTGSNGKVTWSSSNTKIANVSTNGKVSVKKKAGTVTITAKTADGKTAKVKLKAGKKTVKASKVKITAESKTMSLKKKKTQTLKAVVSPVSAANRKVTWKSSNKKIATVNSKGKVTAKKAGIVKITATAKDGSKKKATIKIKIKKN